MRIMIEFGKIKLSPENEAEIFQLDALAAQLKENRVTFSDSLLTARSLTISLKTPENAPSEKKDSLFSNLSP